MMKNLSFTLLVLFSYCMIFCPLKAQTQQEMNQSEEQRYEKADKELNLEYAKLMKVVDESAKEKLKKAQRAWVAYRDAEAEYATSDCKGGTIEPMILFATMANLTEARLKSLKENYEAYAQ